MSLNAFILQLEKNYFFKSYLLIYFLVFILCGKQIVRQICLFTVFASEPSILSGHIIKISNPYKSWQKKQKWWEIVYKNNASSVSQCLNSIVHTYCCNSYSVAVHLVNRIQGLYNILQHILTALSFQRWSVMRYPFSVFF